MMQRFALALALALAPALAWGQAAQPVTPCAQVSSTINGAAQLSCPPNTVAGPIYTAPGNVGVVSLDIASVTTGGTAVTALNAGHRNKGGWLQNPAGAAASLCINEKGTASGTTSAGDTTCIAAGQSYELAPSPNAVSVISSDSSHAFSGVGFN